MAAQATMAAQALALKASPIALRKLKCITVDVTGTLIAYKGLLGDYYCMAAKAAGLPCPDYDRMHAGFKVAYTDMATKYPCFGNAVRMPNVDWWRTVVRNSFLEAGYEYDNEIFDQVFKRIYAMFGSAAPYIIYNDAQPFLRWVRKQGIIVGVVSNAEFRYRDVILPTLGLHQGSEWDFGVFSGIVGFEKPDPRIFEAALQKAGGVAPDQVLHIGDSLRKDYLPARSLGMHALLLDRFQTPEHRAAREAGVPVFPDLSYVQKFIMALQEKAEAAVMI
jgi:REG-2-like HAD superfamily hydrolase